MNAQITSKPGFFAALDQSGGSTPGALRLYGIPDSDYTSDSEMFALINAMRVRVMTAPAFTGDKVIATILFEGTIDGTIAGKPIPTYLWKDRGIVPFLKVDKGLQDEDDGVNLMKPIPGLDAVLARALELGIYGTKARSTIRLASRSGIASNCRSAVWIGRADRRSWVAADSRAGSADNKSRKGGRGSCAPNCAHAATRCSPAGPPGNPKTDDPERAEPLRAFNHPRRRCTRRRTLRRLYTR